MYRGLARLTTEAERLGREWRYGLPRQHTTEVTDTGVIVTDRTIDGGVETARRTEQLSDAEFGEELISLEEVLLAMQLTILPWLWSQQNPGIVGALGTVPPSAGQRRATLALLAGMAGLDNPEVVEDGSRVTISTVPRNDGSGLNHVGSLSLVPATFGAFPDATEVGLQVGDLHSVSFERDEFVNSQAADAPDTTMLVGLVTAKWLLASGTGLSERDDVTYVVFPLTKLHFAAAEFVSQSPQTTEKIDRAVEVLLLVRSRLDRAYPVEQRSVLTRRAAEQIDLSVNALIVLAESRRGSRTSKDGEQSACGLVTSIGQMHDIQTEALEIRDGLPPG